MKVGYVALVGKPNAGKSTLLNAFLGQKLAITANKPQTTRHRILGILSEEDAQIIFLDTPGIIQPKYKLQSVMMQTVDLSLAEADVVVFLHDATNPYLPEVALKHLGNQPALLALNKCDLIREKEAMPLAEALLQAFPFKSVVPISARKKTNLDKLLQEIKALLPEGMPFYPDDMLTEHPEKFFVSEFIREKVFRMFREEVPYSTQVNIVVFEEREGEKDFISAEIVVERDSQKAILLGKRGTAIKQIGTESRVDIEKFLGRPVYLQLHVKVREDWRNRDGLLNEYGYR